MRAVNVDFYHGKFGLAFSNFLSKKRYNVSKRVMRFIFAITCPLTYHLSQTLHLYAISAFKISSYYCIKVVKERKGLSCINKKIRFLSRSLRMHDLRGNYILSLNKPRTTSYGLRFFPYVLTKCVGKCAT